MFLNPLMLLGIGAISVPILIHLLNRHRIQRVTWAAMRFLQMSIEKNQKRMRIEDILMLLLRCVIVALLAVALARPALQAAMGGNWLGTGGLNAVIVLDNSLSMGCSDGVNTRFEQAKQAAEQVLDTLPNGSAVALLLGSDVVDPVIPEPTLDMNLLRKSIRSAELTDRSTHLQSSFARALDILQRKATGRRELYVITDAQAKGFEGISEVQRRLEETKNEIGSHLIIVGSPEERNVSVADLRFAGGIITPNQAQRFEVKVANNGTVAAQGVHVMLAIDAGGAADEATIDLIPPGESRSVSLFARFRQPGLHTLEAKLANDHLSADDIRTIVVRAVESVSVLVLSADGRADDREADAFFLRHALQPVAPEDRAAYHIRSTIRAAAEASTTKWDEFDVVFFVDVPDLDNATADGLADYVKRGGGLVIFPGPKIAGNFYNDQLGKRLGIMPGVLGKAQGEAGQEEKFFALAAGGYEHPVVTIWNDPGAGNLGGARFYRAYGIAPLEHARTIMKWADDSAAALERDIGQGRVVLFSSTANTAWNDLPVRPGLFVPLVSRTIGRLIERQDQNLNIGVGQRWAQRLPLDQLGRDVTFTSPTRGATTQLPEKQSRRVELVNGLAIVGFDSSSLAGEYQAMPEGAEALRFAAQPDAEESRLNVITDEQVKSLEAVSHVVKWSPGVSLGETISAARSGSELWMPVVILVIALVVAETFLGNWFSESK